MKVLQIEDKEEYKLLGAVLVETFEEAKPLIDNESFDFFILDGNFPFNKGDPPGIIAPSVADYIRYNGVSGKIIIWTNSVRAMRFCQDNNIT
ncbi:MAG: hypothetical protein KJ922_04650, partial [Nanoarchaeota archaeon]|nr:hypothetical protein [Nanoarchaeota archaeon]